MSNFCLYIHRKLTNNEIFYVGIGSSTRPYSIKDRNKFWKNVVAKYGYSIQVVYTNLTKEEAIEAEQFCIQTIGRRDLATGPLVNLTAGGDGALGKITSEETKIKMRKCKNISHKNNIASANRLKLVNQKGVLKSQSHKEKLSLSLIGIVRDENTRDKMSKAKSKKIIDTATNIVYDSIKIASETLGINYNTLMGKLSGHTKNNTSLSYL